MSTSAPPEENISPYEDDSAQRSAARIALLKNAFEPSAKTLMNDLQRESGETWSLEKTAVHGILDSYVEYRDQAKRLMHPKDEANSKPLMYYRIDRHKIAAAFLLAILRHRPLRPPTGHNFRFMLQQYANEILAFKTAIRVLAIYAQHDARKQQQIQLAVPIYPNSNGVAYVEHAYRALRHANHHMPEKLTLPIVAHWMFYIEKFWHVGKLSKSLHASVTEPEASLALQDILQSFNEE
ncbi:hypothetical protein V8J88_15030 [Massilia sp. W12]|uniref:hypothetical protein n=1 Tax=Massilia sp. W12 TaxID=3126507 RepID=UPI0030CB9648